MPKTWMGPFIAGVLEEALFRPPLLTGRVGGRSAAAALNVVLEPPTPGSAPVSPKRSEQAAAAEREACLTCKPLAGLVAEPLRGYEHFERVHEIVPERKSGCIGCHAEMVPLRMEAPHFNRHLQKENCALCH